MALTLTDELARAFDQQGDVPLPAVHPSTEKKFFLVSEVCYHRRKQLFEGAPLSLEAQRSLFEQMGKPAGWDYPAMGVYDHEDE